MEYRRLGRHGPVVSAIGLGCLPMSGVYGHADDEAGVAAIRRAIDIGVTLLDTADIYGDGHNEILIGKAIKGRRDEVLVATKFGNIRDEQGRPGISGRPEYVRRACEASLRRLDVDFIDLYQQHRVDPDTPIEETIGALADLVAEGMIGYIGMSEALPADLRRAAAVHPISSLQSEYSLLERSVEAEVLPTCEKLGIGFLAFAPLVRGLLGGSLRSTTELAEEDYRRQGRFPRVGMENIAVNEKLAELVSTIAKERGVSPAQVSLAWLLSRRPWIVPIPGTKRIPYLEDNAGAVGLLLDEDDHRRLDALAQQVTGPRYGGVLQTPTWVSPPAPGQS